MNANPRPVVTNTGFAILVAALTAHSARAQCGERWEQGPGIFNGTVGSMAEYDGLLIMGGDFTTLDGQPATLAAWDGSTIQPFAERPGDLLCGKMLAFGNLLVVAESSPYGSDDRVVRVQAWDGDHWRQLGGDFSCSVFEGYCYISALIEHEGSLYVFGRFDVIGGEPVSCAAQWDGAAWRQIGDGLLDDGDVVVHGAASLNGSIVAAGSLRSPEYGLPDRASAVQWTGTHWTTFYPQVSYGAIFGLHAHRGDLYTIGQYMTRAPICEEPQGIAWAHDGVYGPVGDGLFTSPANGVISATEYQGGLVIANSYPPHGAIPIALWDGEEWHSVGRGFLSQSLPTVVFNYRGELVCGFDRTDPTKPRGWARWRESPLPYFLLNAGPMTADHLGTISLTVTVAPGCPDASIAWLRDGVPIRDGAGGASAYGGIVSGAVRYLGSSTEDLTATLTIRDARRNDSGMYTPVISNVSGSTAGWSVPVTVSSGPLCTGDADMSRTVDFLDVTITLANFGTVYGPYNSTSLGRGLGDVDGNGRVDHYDMMLILHHFGRVCP